MLTIMQWQAAATLLPFLANPEAAITRAFMRDASLVRFAAGTTIFTEGDLCEAFAILLSGEVRVFKIGENGREITLYRFARGESCILTANCILSAQQFPALATVEQNAEAYIVGHTIFNAWIAEYAPWRSYVFSLLAQRLATLMAVVDEVAFRRVDVRLAEFLLRRSSTDQPALSLTHQQIAAELGTAREVISRLLADFAASGLVKIGRGLIEVCERDGLTRRISG